MRKAEAKRVQERLSCITQVIQKEILGSSGSQANQAVISFEIEPWKLNQADHIISTVSRVMPKKVILFLDDEQQPSLSRWINGHISTSIASKFPPEIPYTILSDSLLRRLDDTDIFGDF